MTTRRNLTAVLNSIGSSSSSSTNRHQFLGDIQHSSSSSLNNTATNTNDETMINNSSENSKKDDDIAQKKGSSPVRREMKSTNNGLLTTTSAIVHPSLSNLSPPQSSLPGTGGGGGDSLIIPSSFAGQSKIQKLLLDAGISWFIIQITVIASIGGVLFGYDIGVISTALPQLITTFTLNQHQQQMVVSILYFGGLIGAAIGGTLCDTTGRKHTILITDIIFGIGAFILYIAPSYEYIVFGRIIVGFAVAVSGIADVSYLHEIAPIHVRGAIVSVNEACISLGFLLAFCVGGYLSSPSSTENNNNDDDTDNSDEGWRIMFGISGILAIIQFIGMLSLPESPKWLRENGRYEESEQALRIINKGDNNADFLRHSNGNAANLAGRNDSLDRTDRPGKFSEHSNGPLSSLEGYNSTLDPIPLKVVTNSDTNNNKINNNNYGSRQQPMNQLFEPIVIMNHHHHLHNNDASISSLVLSKIYYYWSHFIYINQQIWFFLKTAMTQYRRQSYITLFLVITQQFCGQNNVISYAPLIFAGVANKNDANESNASASEYVHGWSTLSIGLVKFIVTVLVIWKIEALGRRFLLIAGMSIIAFGLLLLAIAFATIDSSDANEQTISLSGQVLALPGVLLVITGYSMSFGPLTWLLTSELFPTDIRGRALGASTIVTYLCASIVTSTFLTAQEFFGPSVLFAMYMTITCIGIAFALVAVPDTGGKNTKDIDQDLNDMPWWKQHRNTVFTHYSSFAEEGDSKVEIA